MEKSNRAEKPTVQENTKALSSDIPSLTLGMGVSQGSSGLGPVAVSGCGVKDCQKFYCPLVYSVLALVFAPRLGFFF